MFIEDKLEERRVMWGEYLGGRWGKRKSCVKIRDVGVVFIGTIEQCQKYIEDNAHRYAGTHPANRGKNPEVTK